MGGFLLRLPAHVIEPISGEPRAALSRSRLLFLMGNIAPAVNRTVEALTSRSTSCQFFKIRLQILNSLPSFKTPRMAALPLGREQDAAYHAQRHNHRGADPVEV